MTDVIVDIQNACHAKIPSKKKFLSWVSAALNTPQKQAQQKIEVCIRIVDHSESAALNHNYRHKQGPTNILSFPADLPTSVETDLCLLGDLVICAPLVESEAAEQHKIPLMHWAHLVVHGILHLQGHDHENEEEAAVMEALEIRTLANLGFPNPYGECESHAR